MLHHRGYTHTVLGAILGAVTLWAIVRPIRRTGDGTVADRDDSHWLLALLLVATFSHLVLDWTNSYGVHLFWPVDDRWQYGDAVFIIEPWFWVVAVPTLVMATTSRVARALLAFILVVGLAVASWVGVTAIMVVAGRVARSSVLRALHAADASAEALDVAVTPLPANAVCLTAITVERSGERYRVATARVSAAPWITRAPQCGARESANSLIGQSSRRSTSAVQWDTEWSAPANEIGRLARESCPALAALRFIRVPIWRSLDDSLLVLGDARYGGASGSGFSDLRVPRRSATCPPAVPPWVPPRVDLLRQ
jgi:inner membrane protein